MKRLIIGIFILVVLLVGGFAVAIMTLNSIDWSEYEEPIANAVKDATGRELHFSGALNVNIGLSPGISADGVTLQNADWASRDDMLTLEHVEAHLKLLPLIFGQVEVSRLEVIGLDVLLETNREGKGNWEFGLTGGDVPAAVDPEPALTSDDEALLTGAVLTKAVIRDATVVYKDGVTGAAQRFSVVEFVAQMDSASAPLVVDLVATYGAESVELAGEIDGIAGLLAGESLGLDLTVSALGATVAIEGVVGKPLEPDDIEITVNVSGDSLSRLTEFADAPVAGLGAYRIAAAIAGNAESIAVSDLAVSLEAAGAQINATGRIADAVAVTGIDLAVSINGNSIAALSPLADTEIPDLGAYKFAANIAGTDEQFHVTNLSVGIADTQIDGDLKANMAREPMRLEVTLHSPRIDLTRLLPADDSAEPQPDDAATSGEQPDDPNERVFPDDPLPLAELDALDTIDAVVNLAIEELIVDPETTLTNLDVGIHAAPKTVSITPFKLTVMGATVDGRVGLEVVKDAAAVATTLNIRHPSIGDLVEDDGDTMLTGGPLDLDIDVTGSGASIRNIMASLNGSLEVEMGAARINNIWVQAAFADLTTILKKSKESEPIDLHCVTTQFRIQNGVAVPDSLIVDTRGMSLFGDGQIDLRDESLELDFDVLASNVSASSALPPFRVRGTLASPTGSVDPAALAGKVLDLSATLTGTSDAGHSEVEVTEVTAETGPDRCRQRLVVYEQVLQNRASSDQKTDAVVLDKAAEKVEDVLGKLGGFFKKKKK